jgi:RNA polymerase sigma factor (sigma-70 family)
MIETPETRSGNADPHGRAQAVTISGTDAWFVQEILPLEALLRQFLRHNWHGNGDVEDMLQDIYVRVYQAAQQQVPAQPRQFVFAIARNLLIDRVRQERIIPIEAVADLENMDVATDEAAPDRIVIARDELRRLQAAFDCLPPRCREAVMMKQVDGLSRREIAQRMGVSEETVKRHLTNGMCALADLFLGSSSDAGKKP